MNQSPQFLCSESSLVGEMTSQGIALDLTDVKFLSTCMFIDMRVRIPEYPLAYLGAPSPRRPPGL